MRQYVAPEAVCSHDLNSAQIKNALFGFSPRSNPSPKDNTSKRHSLLARAQEALDQRPPSATWSPLKPRQMVALFLVMVFDPFRDRAHPRITGTEQFDVGKISRGRFGFTNFCARSANRNTRANISRTSTAITAVFGNSSKDRSDYWRSTSHRRNHPDGKYHYRPSDQQQHERCHAQRP